MGGERDERPQHGEHHVEDEGELAAALLHRSLGAPGQERGPVTEQRDEREHPGEHGVPVENPDRFARQERREERQLEPSLPPEGHAADQVAERGAEQHREEPARAGEHHVPEVAPQRLGDVAAELDRHRAQHQAPDDQEDREVESGEPGREGARKGDEQHAARGQQPHFVGVPERPDRGEHRAPLRVVARDGEVKRPGAEVVAVEHDVEREHHGEDRVPQLSHASLPRAVRARSRAGSGTRTAGPAPGRARRSRSA